MAHKKKHMEGIPPGNLPTEERDKHAGVPPDPYVANDTPSGQAHDPKRRLGDYDGKGEHPLQQPGGKSDANY